MKKQIMILCGLAAAAGIAFASSEKINFIKDNEVLGSVRLESVDHISYGGDTGEGFTTLDVTRRSGAVTSVSLSSFDRMEYEPSLPANPLSVVVEPHHMCATLHVTVSEPGVWYRFSGMPVSELAGIPEEDWADYLVEDDIAYIYDVAAQYGQTLTPAKLPEIFEQGDQARDWFPMTIISDNTQIALVAYTATIEEGKIKVTTEPLYIPFTTKKIEDCGVRFNLSFDVTSTSLTVKADPYNPDGSESDIPYIISLYSPEDIVSQGLPALVGNTLSGLENMVYNYGMTWDDVTLRGHGEKTYTNRRQGDVWIAVAHGCEYGVATTDASYEAVEIPEATVTDDCTFDAVFTQTSGTEGTVTITPSNPDTRYAAFLVEKSKLESTTPSMYLANKVYYINVMNTFQWPTTEYMHTGASTLSTYTDMIDGRILPADTEYAVLICGLTDDGTRTTEIKELTISTHAQQMSDVTFDVTFGNFSRPNDWASYLDINVVPSDPDVTYVLEYQRKSSCKLLDYDNDVDFMNYFMDLNGPYTTLHKGEFGKTMAFSSNYDYEAGGYVFGSYIVFIFGYDGTPVTSLTAFEVDTATGTVTQIRGMQAE